MCYLGKRNEFHTSHRTKVRTESFSKSDNRQTDRYNLRFVPSVLITTNSLFRLSLGLYIISSSISSLCISLVSLSLFLLSLSHFHLYVSLISLSSMKTRKLMGTVTMWKGGTTHPTILLHLKIVPDLP